MAIFFNFDANLPTQLWIAARYWQSISYLLASLAINKKINANYVMFVDMTIITVLLGTIFLRIFPTCYIEGEGLTWFKIISEYVIILIFSTSALIIHKFRSEFNRKIYLLIILSISVTIISELAFTFYVSVFDISNLIGHVFKIIAFFFMYKAIIEIGIEDPFGLLFRKLKLSDETLRKKANDLEKSYSEFNQMFNASLPMRIISKNCDIIRVNETYTKLFNLTKEEVLGKKCYDPELSHLGHQCNTELCSMKQIEKGKEFFEYKLIMKAEEDRKIVSLVRTVPYTNLKGEFVGIIQNFTDITERSKYEEKISDMARFPTENPNPVLRTSEKYVLLANKPSQVLFNVGEGSRIPEILKKSIEKAFLSDNNIELELKIEDRTYNLVIVPIKEKGYANIYGMDITARKKAEERLGRFVSTVSHELRTPVSVLTMSMDFLENHKDKITPEVDKKLREGISRNIYLLKDLIEDILTLSRIDEGKSKIEWDDYKPLQILNEILTLMEPIGNEKNITFKVEVSNNIILFGDNKKIDQIFRLFIDNAIKYARNGNTIAIKAIDNYMGKYNEKNREGVLFTIKDNGIGIVKEELPFLFQRFFRSEQVTDIPGTGLGLSIAKELIELHYGEVYVESEYGRGTTFFIFLPKIEKKLYNNQS
jgi:PAS domain S-box-containing protein